MTPPEGCHPYREQIGAFLLGKLDGGELEAVRTHLNSCPGCQAEVRELEPVVAALADADPDRIAGDPRPLGDLEESPSAPILGEIHRAHSRRRGYGWSAVAAAAAVFVVSMGLAGASWLQDQNEPIGSSGISVPSGPSAEDQGPDNVEHKKPKAAGPGGGTPPNESSPVSDVKGSSPGGAKPGAAPEKSDPGGGPHEPSASSPSASSPPASVLPTSSPPASSPPASSPPASSPPASSPPASSPPASAPASSPPASAPPASSPPGQDQYKAQP